MNLFEKTDCHAIWFDAGFRNVVQPWLAERDMLATIASPVHQWFPEEKWPHYSYDKPFDKARWDPMAVLHTSGSTGLPKPIVVRQGMICIADAYHNLPVWRGTNPVLRAWSDMTSLFFNPSTCSVVPGARISRPPRLLTSYLVPLFHAAGLYVTVIMTLFWDCPIALSIPERPLSSDLVLECLDFLDADGIILPPIILEEISQSKESMDIISQMNVVAFGGGKTVHCLDCYLSRPLILFRESRARCWRQTC